MLQKLRWQQNADSVWKCLICMDEYAGNVTPKMCLKCRAPPELIQPKERVLNLLPRGSAHKHTYSIEEKATTEYLTKSILNGQFSSHRVEMWRIAEHPPIVVGCQHDCPWTFRRNRLPMSDSGIRHYEHTNRSCDLFSQLDALSVVMTCS